MTEYGARRCLTVIEVSPVASPRSGARSPQNGSTTHVLRHDWPFLGSTRARRVESSTVKVTVTHV